jgi:hypothetical protein
VQETGLWIVIVVKYRHNAGTVQFFVSLNTEFFEAVYLWYYGSKRSSTGGSKISYIYCVVFFLTKNNSKIFILRPWCNILRYWNQLMDMDNTRLCKKVFLWDYEISTNNWSSGVRTIMSLVGMAENFQQMLICDINSTRNHFADSLIFWFTSKTSWF